MADEFTDNDGLSDDDWLPVISHGDGVTIIWATGRNQRELADRIAMCLGEHIEDGDELHISYNAVQSGSSTDPGRPSSMMRPGKAPHTTLYFEHTAFIILRRAMAPQD